MQFASSNSDVISINPGINTTLVMTSEKFIEGFFFGDVNQPNSVPIVSSIILNSTSGNNLTTDNLTCYSTITDGDTNPMNTSVRWYRNSTLMFTLEYNNSYSNGTTFVSLLLSENLSSGDVWMCSANAYDGSVWGEWTNSSNLSLGNSPPTVVLVSPENNNITTNRTPMFAWDGNDIDGNPLTYYLNITCHHTSGGGCSAYGDDNRFVVTTEESYVPTGYFKYLGDNNYYYNWTILASDGIANSSWTTARRIDIRGALEIVLMNDSVNFGTLVMGESKNTTLNLPYPLSLQNDGNCFVNVSVNASQLWETLSSDSDNYRFKIDNYSGEDGAFNWEESKTGWTQMPLSVKVVSIVELNFIDSMDLAEIDLLVSVPNQEHWGDKGSNIHFESSLGE